MLSLVVVVAVLMTITLCCFLFSPYISKVAVRPLKGFSALEIPFKPISGTEEGDEGFLDSLHNGVSSIRSGIGGSENGFLMIHSHDDDDL